MQEFNLGVFELYKYRSDSVLGQWHRLRYLGAKHIPVEIGSFLKIGYDNGDMIELADHD
jgi:hypothetical protein